MTDAASPAELRAAPSVRRRLPIWSVALLAAIVGLALGRFVTYEPDDEEDRTAAAPAVSQAATLSEQVAALEAIVASDPTDATSWRRLGTAYVGRAAEIGDASLYALAERALDEAEALAPADPTILVGRGVLALALHEFARAESLGSEAIDALPFNPDALGVLVDAQVELGKYEEASATLQDMLDARPGLPALARTSYLRELNGDLAGAEEAMRRAVVAGASSPFDLATVTALVGDLQRAAGDIAGAATSYDEAARLVPDLLAAELGRAHVLAARGDLDGAISLVEGSVERHPAPGALFLLADLQHAAGDADGEAATVELVRAAAALQESVGQVVDLEMALFEADLALDPARAVDLARDAYGARPDNVFAADAMAWSLVRSGDPAAALPFAEQAVRLGTADAALQYHAAEVFAAAGDSRRAAEHLALALRAGPMFSLRHAEAVEALAGRLGL